MNLLTNMFFFLILALAQMAMSVHVTSATLLHQQAGDDGEAVDNQYEELSSSSNQKHELERFFSLRKRTTRRRTCKKFPRICLAKGSPGRSCCKNKCVDLVRDRQNCGKCGKKCKYNQICCKGKCVNPSFNRSHCGGCNNACSDGGLCAFGLCSYA